MSPREIVDMLRPGNFEPCVFITNSGHRYEVRHAELAVVTPNGTVRIYRPTTSDAGEVEPFVRVGARNIAAIEPLSIGAG